MNRKVLHSRVGRDGVLHLDVPMGVHEADQDVQITIETNPKQKMTQEEWVAFIDRSAGSITDPEFKRHPQGEYEVRESL